MKDALPPLNTESFLGLEKTAREFGRLVAENDILIARIGDFIDQQLRFPNSEPEAASEDELREESSRSSEGSESVERVFEFGRNLEISRERVGISRVGKEKSEERDEKLEERDEKLKGDEKSKEGAEKSKEGDEKSKEKWLNSTRESEMNGNRLHQRNVSDQFDEPEITNTDKSEGLKSSADGSGDGTSDGSTNPPGHDSSPSVDDENLILEPEADPFRHFVDSILHVPHYEEEAKFSHIKNTRIRRLLIDNYRLSRYHEDQKNINSELLQISQRFQRLLYNVLIPTLTSDICQLNERNVVLVKDTLLRQKFAAENVLWQRYIEYAQTLHRARTVASSLVDVLLILDSAALDRVGAQLGILEILAACAKNGGSRRCL